MTNEAPQRIWLTESDSHWWPTAEQGDTEYVRADLATPTVDARAAALAVSGEKVDDDLDRAGLKRLLDVRAHGIARLVEENTKLAYEVTRLKRGDFTPEELQGLCHNLTTEDRAVFEAGCLEYQKKLFGEKK